MRAARAGAPSSGTRSGSGPTTSPLRMAYERSPTSSMTSPDESRSRSARAFAFAAGSFERQARSSVWRCSDPPQLSVASGETVPGWGRSAKRLSCQRPSRQQHVSGTPNSQHHIH